LAVVAAAAVGLFAGNAMAQSAKATAAVTDLVSLNTVITDDSQDPTLVTGPWTTILSQSIKTANMKDLFINASLECGNYTMTRVKSSSGVEDTSGGFSSVRVRVVIDPDGQNIGAGPSASGSYALPNAGNTLVFDGADDGDLAGTSTGEGVSFCTRVQVLSAKLQGILECAADAVIPTDCTVTDEEIALLVATLNANAFNFVAPDLSSGDHIVEVQAKGVVDASAVKGNAVSRAFAGAGSVTIEEVRMIRGEQVQF